MPGPFPRHPDQTASWKPRPDLQEAYNNRSNPGVANATAWPIARVAHAGSALIGGDRSARCKWTMSTDIHLTAIDTLPILIAPHPVLKTRARLVKPADGDVVRDLIPRMFATMYKAPGIGLAAPQVNTSLRLVVVDLMPNDKRQPYSLINPEVAAASDERATREEGCCPCPANTRISPARRA